MFADSLLYYRSDQFGDVTAKSRTTLALMSSELA